MMICGVGIGMIASMVCWIALPLSSFVKSVDNEIICGQCERKKNHCFAMKETKRGASNRVSDWMVISYLVTGKTCPYMERYGHIRNIVAVVFGFFLYFILFWSGGMEFTGMLKGLVAIALFFLSIVDWNTQYIPLECNIFIFLCGLIQLFADLSNWLEYVIGLIAVSGFLYIVNLIGTPILKKRYEGVQEVYSVIGDGDIKLMAATGLALGWKLNFLALGIGCVAGSAIHLLLMKIKKGERQFALGPYLSLGVYITMICGEQLISWYLSMMGVVPVD